MSGRVSNQEWPRSGLRAAQDLADCGLDFVEPIRWFENLAWFGSVGWSNDAIALHHVDQVGGAAIADS